VRPYSLQPFWLTIVVFILLGCSSGKDIIYEGDCRVIEVDFNSAKGKYEDYFLYRSFITLETTEESLVQWIDKVEFYNDTIFVLDSRQSIVFVFDSTGKYISKIDRKGRSGEEYLSVSDFFIDGSNRIYVYDGRQGVLILYDFKGLCINRIEVEKGYSFTKLPDNNWLFYLGNGFAIDGEDTFYNILVYNENFTLIDNVLPFNAYMQGLKHTYGSVKSVISNYDSTTYILPLLSNYIYSYCPKNSRVECSYKVVFKNKQNEIANAKMKPKEIEDNLKKMGEGLIPSRINNFYKIGNSVFFSFSYSKQRWFCFYDESNHLATLCNFTDDENGLTFSPVNYFSNKKKEEIVSIVEGDAFITCKKLDKKNNSIIHSINESIHGVDDPNPILVFYTLKL